MSPERRFFRPTWAEVDIGRLKGNISRFKSRLSPKTKLLFVVKADAYGHGAVACARAAGAQADWLGVTSVEEGVALREAGIRRPILILGSLYPFESFLAAAEHGLTPTVASLESARRLAQAARHRVSCHIKIDTGMNRIGVRPEEGLKVVEFLAGCRKVRVEGIYTHLSCADSDAAFTRAQLARFKNALQEMARWGRVPLRHAANSAGALRFPASRLDMVRPGLALYGLYPGFEPILSLKTKMVFIKNVSQGTPIGYGASYRTKRPSRIATLPIGYADGLPRALSGRGEVSVGGRRCPIVGKISMDMTTVDVTRAGPVRVGDDVEVIGSDQTASAIARSLGTIPYEVVCAISKRVPRVYLSA